MTGSGASSGSGFTGLPRPLRDRPAVDDADADDAGGARTTELVHVPSEATAARAPVAGGWRPTLPAGLAKPSRIVPLVAAALAMAVGAVVVGGQGTDGPAPGEAIVTVDGLAIVHRADGRTDRVEDRTRLEPGDRLRVARGSASLELNDDVTYAALAEREDVPATELRMGRTPRLVAGPLLVTAPRATELVAGDGRVRLDGASAARITRTLASRVDVYRGRATLDSAGATRGVPALRSAEVVAEGDLTGTRPLTYAADHPWDRRFLGPALALDRELEPLVVGMEASGVDGAALAERIRAGADGATSTARLRALLAGREAPIDAAVGVAVVGAATAGSFEDRWVAGVRFHDAGAPWGLVALDLGADPDAVIDTLAAAIDTTSPGTEEVAAALPAGPTASSDPAAAGPDAADAATTSADVAAAGADGTPGGGETGPGSASPGATVPNVTVPGVTVPGVTVPGVTVPGVTLPPVTLPPVPVVTTVVQGLGGLTTGLGGTVGSITAPLTCSPGVLAPVTGTGGLLGGVTGSGGLLPLCP